MPLEIRWLAALLCRGGLHHWTGFETPTAAFRRCTRPGCRKRQFWFSGAWKDVPAERRP